MCLSNNAVFFFASLHSQPHRLRSHGYCVCVVVTWIGAMSPAGNTSSHTIRVQFPLSLFSPIVPVFKCRKNRYPLINSKAVKILSSPKRSRVLVKKCWTSHCLHGTKKKVEPSGRKSWCQASCNEKCPTPAPHQSREIIQCKWHVSLKIMDMLWALYIHTGWWTLLIIICYGDDITY